MARDPTARCVTYRRALRGRKVPAHLTLCVLAFSRRSGLRRALLRTFREPFHAPFPGTWYRRCALYPSCGAASGYGPPAVARRRRHGRNASDARLFPTQHVRYGTGPLRQHTSHALDTEHRTLNLGGGTIGTLSLAPNASSLPSLLAGSFSFPLPLIGPLVPGPRSLSPCHPPSLPIRSPALPG